MATSLAYPDLSTPPSQDGTTMNPRDYTLADDTEYAYRYSRPKVSRFVRGWTIAYKDLGDTDLNMLWDFWKQVGMYNSFWWTNPFGVADEVGPFEVRITAFAKPEYVGFGDEALWNTSLDLEEV